MFISATYLEINYGVTPEIAKFFVDREPPLNNLYWKDKLLYLRPAPGYLFIPLIVDLLHKAGIPKEELLSSAFLNIMEAIGHLSAREEIGDLSQVAAIFEAEKLVSDVAVNLLWLEESRAYFHNTQSRISGCITPFKALHRGDLFLFSLCMLSFPNRMIEEVANIWFSLISILLLLDDAEDMQADKRSGEPNAFLESGLSEEGLSRIADLVSKNLRTIAVYNKTMANGLDQQIKEVFNQPHIQQVLTFK